MEAITEADEAPVDVEFGPAVACAGVVCVVEGEGACFLSRW